MGSALLLGGIGSMPTLSLISTVVHAEDSRSADIDATDTSDDGKTTGKLLDTVTVNGRVPSSVQESKEKLDKIAGAVSVIDNTQVDQGRNTNLEDVLSLQPGIFAQSTSGTEANKVTIRGSGLNTFYGGYSLGLTYLYNGIPITGAAGTQEDLLSMHAVNHTEVLYGANAYDYSALSLGGAINFITENGYTSPGAYIRSEFGSYGYQKEQLSYGGVTGGTDYYVSVQHNYRSGYQDDTAIHGNDIFLSVGHIFSPKLKTRVFIRWRKEDYINGSPLTLDQIAHDPTANNYQWPRWKPGTTLIGSNTTYTFDDGSTLDFGLGVDNFPLIHAIGTEQWYQSTDLTTSLRYKREDQLFGRSSDTTLTFSNVELVRGWMQQKNVADPTDLDNYDQNLKNNGSRDTVYGIGNDLQVLDEGWIASGISVSDIIRNIRIAYDAYPNTTGFPNSVDYRSWGLAPRLGFRYQFTPEFQGFINASRAINPPVTWEYDGGTTSDFYLQPLRNQTSTTGEIGVRGSGGIFDGSLTIYRSWVYDELLTTVLVPATATSAAVTATTNGSPTIHQGIEAGLAVKLWQDGVGDRLTLRQAYTVNDFYYVHDSAFGDNQLPGIPRWVYQGALQYDDAIGFYAQANVRSASSYYVDFANTWRAPFYTITGAKLGYEAPGRRWTVFLEGKNLTNRRYVTATNTSYNLQGAIGGAAAENFYMGDGRSVYGGFSFRY